MPTRSPTMTRRRLPIFADPRGDRVSTFHIFPVHQSWICVLKPPYSNQAHDAGLTYFDHAYKDGYTNKGFVVADWIGRDSTGYQAWLTYWISPREQVQAQYRDAKLDSLLRAGGGTQTDFSIKLVKRISRDFELNSTVQYERWLIPM